jgi:succinate dehydrogenase/fumarate reductase flavoprotein subunit
MQTAETNAWQGKATYTTVCDAPGLFVRGWGQGLAFASRVTGAGLASSRRGSNDFPPAMVSGLLASESAAEERTKRCFWAIPDWI